MTIRTVLRASFLVAASSLFLAACQQTTGSGPQLANTKPKTQTTAPSSTSNGSYAASGGIGPQIVARVEQPKPRPRPPVLPSLEDLIGRLPTQSPDAAAPTQAVEPPPVPVARGLRVAVLLPLSGANQRVGSAMLNAAQMALFDFAGNDFEMLVHDTQGTPEGAREAARLAIGDGAELIVGPLLAPSVRAVTELAQLANVPVMAFSSDRTVVGPGVYTMGFFPGDEVSRVVQYAAAKGLKRFALLAPEGPYGEKVSATFNAAVWEAGGFVVESQFYDPKLTDFSEPVKRIAHYDERRGALVAQRNALKAKGDEVSDLALKRLGNLQTMGELPYDALLVADGGRRLIAVSAMLPFYDIDPKKVKILGTGQFDEPGLGAEPALVGSWYAAPNPVTRQKFSDEYLSAYGNRPHRLATLAYDATALAVLLGPHKYDATVLSDVGGFSGKDGLFRFNQNGEAERGLAVMEVRRKDARVIDPAPTAF